MKKTNRILLLGLISIALLTIAALLTKKGKEATSIQIIHTENEYTLQINTKEKGVDISDTMYGLFFEDINFAGDGGLYAELIKNRSFEYTEELANKGALHGYKQLGNSMFSIENTFPIHENNPSYLVLTNPSENPSGFINSGFLEGIHYKTNETYRFSVYLRSEEYRGDIRITLLDNKDNAIGVGTINGITTEWNKHTIEIIAEGTAILGKLSFELLKQGSIDVDMVSLFPVNTYKNRENGLRKDMVEIIEQLNPSFIRFPGGCIVEGTSMETAYNWKDTIGDVAHRKQNTNLWIGTREHPFYQSYGLGFYEYFLLCEDLDAKPIPVINAGLSCQVRKGNAASMEDLDRYIQDALDLIEFANGDSATEWGKIRIQMGHPEPFHLEYLAVGNENWDQVYFSRYRKFVDAIRQEYPHIKIIASSGPLSEGFSYNYAWNMMNVHKKDELKYADIMDEHYYNSAEWFLANNHRYDTYKRNFVDVFVGEYAAKSNSLFAAIAEAAYMTGLERNADVVKMTSYAPLFGNLISRQWSPDLIYFNNSTAYGSINYYVQKMFANHVGDYTLTSVLTLSHDIGIESEEKDSLYETVSYDKESNDIIIKLVNAGKAATVIIDIKDEEIKGEKGELEVLAGESKSLENTILKQNKVTPVLKEIAVSESFSYDVPAYSLSVIRIPMK